MKKITSLSLTILLAISVISMSITPNLVLAQTVQEKLTNQSVIDMVKVGLSTEIIITKIKSSPSSFDTSSNALQVLKKAGVSDSVVLAMVKKESGIVEETVMNTSSDGTMTTEVKLPDGTEIKLATILFCESISGFL